ncbi:thymidine kinase [Holospora obtusa F1]|uniref:Thymidine kinase n=1 Tax=Holospora obtusa F1 TaxID=1399147 RepID=W6TTI9_HOLOB|nr:thymidine kinase [Holospora obtusa]ETZ07102.1 thymidine kinase [Holospora obtusa F1]
MSKLYFYYATMNAGKTTNLIQSKYNYEEQGMSPVVFTAAIDTRFGMNKITSRVGLSIDAISFDEDTNFLDALASMQLDCLFVDEAQFLNKRQVQELLKITYSRDVPVLCYGLRSDFKGELFEGSKYLLAWADKLQELKSICFCGKKATMNARLDKKGNKMKEGDQIAIEGATKYNVFCAKHFFVKG